MAEETGFEEHFGVSKSEFLGIERERTKKFLSGLLVIEELSVWDGIWVQDSVSLFKVSVLKPVWITFSANSNTFEDTVTSKLVDGQMWTHFTWFFVLVWYDAPNEMWRSGLQVGHESLEGFSVKTGNSLHGTTLLLLFLATGGLNFLFSFNSFFWTQPVRPDLVHERETGFFEKFDNGTVQWILVLFEPVGDVVANSTGVMVEFEINVSLTLGFGGGFTEVLVFTHVGQVQLVLVGFVGGFWEHTFFFKSGQDSEWFFDQLDASSEIHTEIDGLPEDTFFLVFFLFNNEHMVVEELLKFLVGEVDAQLFESVETEDFETGDIEATDEELSWQVCSKSFVTLNSNIVEKFFEDTLGQSSSGVSNLFWSLTLGYILVTNLDSWGAQVFAHISGVDSEEIGGLVGGLGTVDLTLFFSLLLFKNHTLKVEDSHGDLPDSCDDFLRKIQNFEGFLSGFEFFTVIKALNGDFSHTDVCVLVWILDDQALFEEFWLSAGKNLVENMVISFTFKLVGDSRFFQKVSLNITGGKFTVWSEVDSDKFTEPGRVIVPGSFGVTESLHGWVSSDNLVFKGSLAVLDTTGSDHGKVLDDFFGVDSFTGSGFTGDQHRLVMSINEQVLVSGIGDRIKMRWHLSSSLASVAINHFLAVDWKHLVWIDGDTEKTGVGVDNENSVSITKIEEDGRLVQVGHVGHILHFVHLGWILHLFHGIFFLHFDFFAIAKSFDEGHTVFDFGQETLLVEGFTFWYPDELFTLIGFGVRHQLVLFLVGHSEVASGIAELFQKRVTVHCEIGVVFLESFSCKITF
jgi:hypothetical protein